ncbi:MAG: hypothetical protein HYU56_05310 [Candidatus Aenigmarchaeota archaeon]|nr:hypothetical protein [Candidatus Aenigmarchaeota archaeon]
MKGITPVIAVILLLLITVSLVAFAYTWFTRVATTAATGIENQTSKLLATKSIRIENAKVSGTTTNIDLRNTGDVIINSGELAFYIEDGRVVGSLGCPASIAPGSVVTCSPPAKEL